MVNGRMAARSILLIRQYNSVSLKQGPAHRTRACLSRIFQQKPLLRRNYQNICPASTLSGKKQYRASITNSVHQAYPTSKNRLVILIASASAVLLWALSPPPSSTRTRFDSPDFRDEDQWSRVNRLLRRATFYADKGDYAEVYEATQLALEECDRLGLRIDEPFVLRIYLDSAGALFKQGMHEEALDTLQLIPETCKVALRDLDEKG